MTKLTIELVPQTSWFTNLRSLLPKAEWDQVRKSAYKASGYRCEICGGQGKKWPVECHETWDYNDTSHTQTLTGVVALCPDCHQVKHIGLATIKGYQKDAINHLCKVNQWTQEQGRDYVRQCFQQYRKRSEHQWTVDISWVNKKGPNKGPLDGVKLQTINHKSHA